MLMKRLLRFLGLLPGLLAVLPVSASLPSDAQVAAARNAGLAWLIKNQQGDGSWNVPPGLEAITAASAIEAFVKASVKGVPLGAAVTWLANSQTPSTDSLARSIGALGAAGFDTSAAKARLLGWNNDLHYFTGTDATLSRSIYPGWGGYDQYALSFIDSALAVRVLNVGGSTNPSLNDARVNNTVCSIVALRQPAGAGASSWPYAPNPKGDTQTPTLSADGALLPTAYSLLALVPFATTTICAGVSVGQAINEAILWLLNNKKNGDGGFGDGSVSSPLETAVVYQALAAYCPSASCAVAAAPAARDNALGYLLAAASGGSWGGNALTTATVLQALPAVSLLDSDGDGVPDVVDQALGRSPYKGDRQFAANSGQGTGVAGATPLVAKILIKRPYSYLFTPRDGTPPYTWNVVAGTLPTGLNLASSTGTLSGTPTVLGTYAFTYRVTDAAHTSADVSNQIQVVRNPGGIVPVIQMLLLNN